jgi:protein-S-isoprenylcysteine O-methyltransferase Ste14
MHGDHRPSGTQKLTFVVLHLAILGWGAWLLLDGGAVGVLSLFGWIATPAEPVRRAVLVVCGLIYWLRLTLGTFIFMRRRMDGSEVAVVVPWLLVIHTTFALLGATATGSIGWLFGLGLALYAAGSLINTVSEYQRHRWKQVPAHGGHLYTGGLFRYARHVNYFGDIVLFSGWALATGRLVALVLPAIMTVVFVFEHAPRLDRYLAERYGDEYARWAAETPRLVPFLF